MDRTKGEIYYIMDLIPWIMEDTEGGLGNRTNYGKEYWLYKGP